MIYRNYPKSHQGIVPDQLITQIMREIERTPEVTKVIELVH